MLKISSILNGYKGDVKTKISTNETWGPSISSFCEVYHPIFNISNLYILVTEY